ncbi:MAG: hypothetical protein JWO95_65 [Verrucomicrobiales bacterium]|nr:hypothetical protein [Verrucomicrobiales bacterium]
MKEFLQLAFQGSVAKRALKFALVVGCVLTAINHGDAILRGDMDSTRIFKIALTALVPYTVSTLSSVAAMRERRSATVDSVSASPKSSLKP